MYKVGLLNTFQRGKVASKARSRYGKGVTMKKGRYEARFRVNGLSFFGGLYDHVEEARYAYNCLLHILLHPVDAEHAYYNNVALTLNNKRYIYSEVERRVHNYSIKKKLT